ncbi:hypothetical protein [Hyphococcus sp.]|uniref:hypothetical protein n=1 Tax=Hyphococcus sp. TaxID=2038636 RepID=UPI003D0A5381
MTKAATKTTNTNTQRPAHRVFLVQEDDKGETHWTELCSLWPTKNRPGFTGPVKPNLAIKPFQGRIVVLPATFQASAAKGAQ